MNTVFKEAMELFEVPPEFWESARPMYREYELLLAVNMKKNQVNQEKILDWMGEWKAEAPEQWLGESYSRCVLDKCLMEDGSLGYCITDFYTRYPYFAQYEPEEYAKYPEDIVGKMNDWEMEIYLGRNREDFLAIAGGADMPQRQSVYLTLQEAYEMAEGMGEEMIIVPCNCKAMGQCTEKPVNVCINKLDKGWNTPYDRGLGEIKSLEETKAWIREINKKGLMQCQEHDVMCNCDGKYCYPVKAARILQTQKRYPISRYEVMWNQEACIQCGKCTKICNFQAFYKDSDKKVVYDESKCWGCTICASNCPVQAITLKSRADG